LIVGIVFLILSIAVGFGAWWYVRMLDTRMAAGRSRRASARGGAGAPALSPGKGKKRGELSAQDIWGVEEIRSGIIVSGDGWYRALLKIGPIDYHIMNEDEQYSIESVLMSTAMALGFRVQLFSTSQLVDTKSCALAIRSYLESVDARQQGVPAPMAEYGLYLYSYLDGMMRDRSVHNRPRYVAVSCYTMDGFDSARGELERMARMLTGSLRRAKITASVLPSDQVLDVLYRFSNRGRVARPSEAVAGGARDLYATGRRDVQDVPKKEQSKTA
jgi:hypothetical protein